MPTATPIINGFVPEWAEVQITLGTLTYLGVKSIEYDSDSDGVDVMGTHPEAIARTAGSNKHRGSVEMYLPDAAAFLAGLGDDYRKKTFQAKVSYSLGDGTVLTDVLVDCLVKGISDSHQQGSDGLTRKFDIRPFRIKRSSSAGVFNIPVVTDIVDPFV